MCRDFFQLQQQQQQQQAYGLPPSLVQAAAAGKQTQQLHLYQQIANRDANATVITPPQVRHLFTSQVNLITLLLNNRNNLQSE